MLSNVYLFNRNSILQQTFQTIASSEGIHVTLADNLEQVPTGSLLLCLFDYFELDFEKQIVTHCRDQQISYFRANLLFETATIGPFYYKNSSCIHCLYERLAANKRDDLMFVYANYNYLLDLVDTKQLIWRQEFLEIVCYEVISWLQAAFFDPERVVNNIVEINDGITSIRNHYLYKNEYCSACFQLPNDVKELAQITFESRIKPSLTTYRLREDLDPKQFKRRMVDLKTGKTMHSYYEVESKYVPMVGTENYIEHEKNEGAFGRTFDFHSSELSAYLEALERYSNVVNRKSFSQIYASYNEVKDFAINPQELTLHDEKYMNEHFRLHKYTEDTKFHWVWGYSLKKEQPLLIPEQMVFYKDELARDNAKRFVYETSNGCALGSSLEEAILYGLFEVIERDNFLVAWYNRLQLTEIDISELGEDFRILNEIIKQDGYEVRFFDTTMELGIPSVWALMINEREDAVVKTYSAAGCHFNPEKALMSAFIEVVSSVPVYNKVFGEDHLVKRKNLMFEDGDLATEFQDHVLLYAHPNAVDRLSFLTNTNDKKTLKELYPSWYETNQFKNKDLTKDLQELLNRIYQYYEDVYVVDISGDFIQSFDLRCVKVFVPGMLTMTFGHQYRRMNLERILNGPVLASRLEKPIQESQINPYPHPFP
ncbi:TOMM precursor leader peptide-binding protein [Bacillus kwashiorkori]|uniref:TOMM precursor leader peptide-binding protein n=1 Tax=Bacillus kwashiorkori TaxID=1522318 RepID=UPI000781BB4A|nr:TOMM precursor leader peptide-binding protein [Bacillus kwashiorkori]